MGGVSIHYNLSVDQKTDRNMLMSQQRLEEQRSVLVAKSVELGFQRLWLKSLLCHETHWVTLDSLYYLSLIFLTGFLQG